ncbi:MAG TPA: DNA polymerase IV [Rhodospirillales bacterium]|nr:DNA polymerase IV [Rhodospirillales bacterium]HJO68472.1 DNA polymerase IV [Rhodospirillales bacterium]
MPAICRDCDACWEDPPADGVCEACGSSRVLAHPELDRLAIAHVDCDAFYAAIEKRDRPELRPLPVIVGGGRRGVVTACCYIARRSEVRSAMPMFKALKLCPNATVIRPEMEKYRAVGAEVRALMQGVTPLVEPLSVDEAFLDLSGTESLHGGWPARTLARLCRRIEDDVGITASVGLSYNKSLAKIASDLEKPRGFAVIGRAEAVKFLAPKPVDLIWGVGPALGKRLEGDGIATIGELRMRDEADLVARYGAMGRRLARFARGEDSRPVEPHAVAKSISAETTFDDDLADLDALASVLWGLAEKVARRLKDAELGAGTVTLKLKTAGFRTITRSRTLPAPTRLAEVLYRTGRSLLEREADGHAFRLIGIASANFVDAAQADPPDLAEPDKERWARIETAVDTVRSRFGSKAIAKGRAWRKGATGAAGKGRGPAS